MAKTDSRWRDVCGRLVSLSQQLPKASAQSTPGDIPSWVGNLTLRDLRAADAIALEALASDDWPECSDTMRAQLHLRIELAGDFCAQVGAAGQRFPYANIDDALENLLTESWYQLAIEWSQRRWASAPLRSPSEPLN